MDNAEGLLRSCGQARREPTQNTAFMDKYDFPTAQPQTLLFGCTVIDPGCLIRALDSLDNYVCGTHLCWMFGKVPEPLACCPDDGGARN